MLEDRLFGKDLEAYAMADCSFKCERYDVAVQQFYEFLARASMKEEEDHPAVDMIPQVHELLAECHWKLGNYKDAVKEQEHAYQSESPYFNPIRDEKLRTRFLYLAEKPKELLASEVTTDQLKLLIEGLAHNESERFEDAEQVLGTLILTLPSEAKDTHAIARRSRCYSLIKMGHEDEAQKEFERGVEWYGDEDCYGLRYMTLFVEAKD